LSLVACGSSQSEMNPLASSAVGRGLSGPQNDERHTEERFQRLRAKIEKYWLFRLTATGSTARSIARSDARRNVGQSGLSLLLLSERRITILRQSGRMLHRPQRTASMSPCATSSPDSAPLATRLFQTSIANAQDMAVRQPPVIRRSVTPRIRHRKGTLGCKSERFRLPQREQASALRGFT
jgi:hypothetical protein